MAKQTLEVRTMWGQQFSPDEPSVLVTNDNLAELWPRIPEERQAELLKDGHVIVTGTEPEPGEEPAPAPDPREPQPRPRRSAPFPQPE